jgi:hypothetical protein
MRVLFFALFSFIFLSASSQTVEEVIQKYTINLGGLEAYNKLKTAKFTGNITNPGNNFTTTIYVLNGRGCLTESEINGTLISNACKDGKGWKKNPLAGINDPVDLSAAELAELKPQTMLASPLADYKARGYEVVLTGQEDVEGKKAFVIKLTDKERNKVVTYYINASDYLLIKSVTDRQFQGQTIMVESWFSDLKEINGVKFYLTRIQKVNGEEVQSIKYNNIELDIPIDEKMFDKP